MASADAAAVPRRDPTPGSIWRSLALVFQSGTASFFNILFSIVRAKFVATLIGTTGAGLLGQLASLVNLAGFVSSAGLPTGLINELSVSRGQGDAQRVARLSSTYLLATAALAAATCAVLLGAARSVSLWLFDSAEHADYIRYVAVSVNFLGLTTAAVTFLGAHKRIKALMYYGILGSFGNSLLTVVLLYAFGIDGVAYAILLNAIVSFALGVYFCRNAGIASVFDVSKRRFEPGLLRLMLRYGSVATVSSVVLQLSEVTTKSIIIRESGLSAGGIYQAAANIALQYMALFLSSLGIYLLPHLAESHDLAAMRSECNNSLRVLLALAAPALLGVAVLGESLIALLYSRAFTEAGSLLSLMVIGDVFKIANKVVGTLIVARRHLVVWLVVDVLYAAFLPAATQLLYPVLGLRAAPVSYIMAAFLGFLGFLVPAMLRDGFGLDARNRGLLAVLTLSLVGVAALKGRVPTALLLAALAPPAAAIAGLALTREEWAQALAGLRRLTGRSA